MDENEVQELGNETQPAPAPAPETVPLPVLIEQRDINKQLKAELQASRERAERMDQTFQKLLTQLNEKQQQESPAPAFEQDPLGHFQHENQKLSKQISEISSKLEEANKGGAEQQQVRVLAAAIQESEADIRATTPDYDQAVKHLKDVRRQDLKDLGYQPHEIRAILDQEALGLADRAIKAGKTPAEAAYAMAKRYGYKPQQQDETIATIAKGMDMSKTVSGGRGGGISLGDLARLPDDQAEAIFKDEKKFQALIRGEMIH